MSLDPIQSQDLRSSIEMPKNRNPDPYDLEVEIMEKAEPKTAGPPQCVTMQNCPTWCKTQNNCTKS